MSLNTTAIVNLVTPGVKGVHDKLRPYWDGRTDYLMVEYNNFEYKGMLFSKKELQDGYKWKEQFMPKLLEFMKTIGVATKFEEEMRRNEDHRRPGTANSDINVIYWNKRVREQIIDALGQDLDGGESIMKEVWEECGTDDQYEYCKGQLREVIDLIKADIK